jgi:ATP-dependent RNA helicase DeaD
MVATQRFESTVTFGKTSPPLARALAERDYSNPTPVQTAVLADDAAARDLLVSAQTGSGKTVAYGLAIAANLLGDAERLGKAGEPLALIVAPTRELALQVHRELTWLYQYAGARVVSCVGGMDPRSEQRELAAGAHIVVGTPGRLCDHLRRGRLDVSALKAVVLDEADEMLDMGFREDMEFILKTTPETRRTLLFSATLPRGIVALAKQYQHQAFRVEVTDNERGHADIEYRAIRIPAHAVDHAVVNLLRFFESPSTIVFCNTRNAVRHLQATLLERGFSVVALSGELTQNERTQALQALRDGRARVCVATDVAARGIDLPNLGLVIHADLPNDAEVLQHRSGRTGRAGRKGVSVLLVPSARRKRAELLLHLAGVDAVWGAPPTVEEIRQLDQQRMMQDEFFTEPASEEDLELARLMLEKHPPEIVAAALARLYRERHPSPEDVADPGPAGRSRDDRGLRNDDRHPRKNPATRAGAMEGGVWFRAAIGRQKNAEARWLLPMICRRGGISKQDIGAIRIFDTHSEFEVSAEAAERFVEQIKRPDKEDNIRLELRTGESSRHDAKGKYPKKPNDERRVRNGETEPSRERPLPDDGSRGKKLRPDAASRHEGRAKFERPAYQLPAQDAPGFSKKPKHKKKKKEKRS